jgi:formate/nitrite transporter FocA (FNT family)
MNHFATGFFCDWLVVFHVFYAPTAKESLITNKKLPFDHLDLLDG